MKKIRRSQYISPFGVGAIYDLGTESLIAQDISQWTKSCRGEKISLKRLSKKLRVREFRMPEVQTNFWSTYVPKLPFSRFPRWLFCSSCRSLKRLPKIPDDDVENAPRCDNPRCGRKALTPMRFVAACKAGHLADIDWHRWAHSRKTGNEVENCQVQDKLKFRTIPKRGGGLGSLEVYCSACNQKRDLSDLFNPASMTSIGRKCSGKQPWQGTDEAVDCPEELRVTQRGASNLYFPKVISALDIPTEKKDNLNVDQEIMDHQDFSMWQKFRENMEDVQLEIQKVFINHILEDIPDASKERIYDLIENADIEDDNSDEEIKIDENEVLEEEWPVLLNPPTIEVNQDFSAHEEKINNEIDLHGLDKLFEKVVLISKLREVRALRGFQRLVPNNDSFVPVDLKGNKDWLPAIEVFGEGIFIAFSNTAIEDWEEKNSKALSERLSLMKTTYEQEELSFLPNPSARFVLLHTFSHLLIRQLSFECGYSSSALRERIYCNDSNMAGILIYTADSDSEGALGGLVRQGKSDRFTSTVLTALERGSWCSTDPVCKELPGQGMRGLNRAACHACSLLSETSCTTHNALLDRMLLLGKDEKYNYGFFNSVLDEFWRSSIK